jgi:hypothetical protein
VEREEYEQLVINALEKILGRVDDIQDKVGRLMAIDAAAQKSLDNLTTQVAAETDAETAAEAAFTGLAAQIAGLKTGQTDPAVLAAIDNAAALVQANAAKLSAAVAANTPATS